jgi:hypothetical protein
MGRNDLGFEMSRGRYVKESRCHRVGQGHDMYNSIYLNVSVPKYGESSFITYTKLTIEVNVIYDWSSNWIDILSDIV